MKRQVLLFFIVFASSLPLVSRAQVAGMTGTSVGDSDIYNRARQENNRIQDPALRIVPVERIIMANEFRRRLLSAPAAVSGPVRPGAVKSAGMANVVAGLQWTERGPTNVGGRTRGLIFDQNDKPNGYKKVFAGGVGGGLWYTLDIAASPVSWNKINDFFDNIAISFIAQDPSAPQVLYASTGESFGVYTQGLGIWKSTDDGKSWNNLTSTRRFPYISSMVIDLHGNLYISGDFIGIQKSANGGQTWTQVVGNGTKTHGADIERSANGDLYASTGDSSTGEVFYSAAAANGSNLGDTGTWVNITPDPLGALTTTGNDWWRIKLACAPNDPNTVYGLFVGKGKNNVSSVQRYDLAKQTWSVKTVPSETFSNGQGWYALSIAVDPNNSNTVVAGSLDTENSTDGGATWNQLSSWSADEDPSSFPYVHADHHTYVFAPGSSSRIILGTDGGVSYSANINTPAPGLPAFLTQDNGYNVTQFYAVALHPTNLNYALAGAQDNGTQQFTQPGLNATGAASDGDGAAVFIDQLNPDIQITSYIYNNRFLSTDNGKNFKQVFFNDHGGFINPSDYSSKTQTLYSGDSPGSYFRWSNVAAGKTSDGVSVPVPDFQNAEITAVTVAARTSNRVYFGLNNGNIVMVDSANNSTSLKTKILIPSTSSNAVHTSVSCIAIDPVTENHLLVTYSNYGVTSVFESRDALSPVPTWTPVEGNLPDMPVRWAMFYPGDSTKALISTELGVWSTATLNGLSTSWTPSNNGLANTRVDMLKYRTADHTLAAATYGRGLFTCFLPQLGRSGQILTFNQPAVIRYGDADLVPGATSTNAGTPVTYTSSNLATGTITVTGKFHILAAGTTTITASQAGNATFSAALSVTQIFTVRPDSLTVTAVSRTKMYNDSIPRFTVTYTGFRNKDSVASLSVLPVITTPATITSPVGVYPINVSGARAANYVFAYRAGTLTILQASQTLTFNPHAALLYGDADLFPGAKSTNPANPLAYTSSNLLTATITPAGKMHIVGAGTTTITASQLATGSYKAAVVLKQVFTVLPDTLNVTVLNTSKSFNDSVPHFNIRYAGFKNGDSTGKLLIQPVITTSATKASPVGIYRILVSGGSAANYVFLYHPGVLVITPAIPVLSFSPPLPATYGDADLLPGAKSTVLLNPITYSSSNQQTATITAAGKIHITGAGTSLITASQPGSGNYKPAVPVTTLFTVLQDSLIVTTADKIKVFNDSIPKFQVSYSGFKNGDTTSVLLAPAVAGTPARITSGVGVYPIILSGARAANYAFSYRTARLTITQASQTLTFSLHRAISYGDADLLPGAQSNNPSNPVLYTSSTPKTVTITPSGKLHIVGSGTTIVTASQPGTLNYKAALPVAHLFTVLPDTLNVSVLSTSKSFNDSVPRFIIRYTGFRNGDSTGQLLTPVVAITSATKTSPVGIYRIMLSGGSAANYIFLYHPGTLVIKRAMQTLTFKIRGPMTYGDADVSPGAVSTNSAIAISYTSSDLTVGTITPGGKFHITGTGTTTITALQNGDINYTAASSVTQLLTVNKAIKKSVGVTEIPDLTVNTTYHKADKTVGLALSGADVYLISLNGKKFSTAENQLDLQLNKGTNLLAISTVNPLQGTLLKRIFVTDAEQVYPNPFTAVIHVNLANLTAQKAVISIFNLNGNLVCSTSFAYATGIIDLNLPDLSAGIYLLKLQSGKEESVFKIIKK